MSETIGFIGMGEAGTAIAKGLKAAGAPVMLAYDAARENSTLCEQLEHRAAEVGIDLASSLAMLVAESTIVISTVTANSALALGEAAAKLLQARHLYADLNSVSPAVKQAIERAVSRSGAAFVEGAVMDAVAPHGHRVPILLGGRGAARFVAAMRPYGMRLETISDEVGPASATKMFRSIVVKGLEALILECLLAARPYGVEARVFRSVGESFPGLDWDKLAHYLVGRTALHGARRAREMEEVAETLRNLGIEPIMASAAARRIAWTLSFGLRERFAGAAPQDYREVIRAVEEANRR